jgi:DNA-directed RNA polymerase subunit RPC12/RpoP
VNRFDQDLLLHVPFDPMMTASNGGESIVAALLDYDHVGRLRELGRERARRCPGCGEPVHFKAPTQRVWHFAHYPTRCPCFLREDADYDPETPAHRWAKAALARWLSGLLGSNGPLFGQAQVVVEGRIPETGQFADVLCVTPTGRRIALEVQASPLSVTDWKKRAGLYASEGIEDVWLLCGPRWSRTGMRLGSLEATILRERGRVFFLDVPEDLLDVGAVSRDGSTPWQRRLERSMDGFTVTCLDGVARAFHASDGTPEREGRRQADGPLADRSAYLHAPTWAEDPDRYARSSFRESGVFRSSLPNAVVAPDGIPFRSFFASTAHEVEAARVLAWDEASAAWTAAHGDEIERARRESVRHPGAHLPAPAQRPSPPREHQGSLWADDQANPSYFLPSYHRTWIEKQEEAEREAAREARARRIVAQSLREMREEELQRRARLRSTSVNTTYTCTLCGERTTSPIVVTGGGEVVKCRSCVRGASGSRSYVDL